MTTSVPPLTEAREHVAGLLTPTLRAAGVPLHTAPPEVVGGACVVLVPGEPWGVRRGLHGGWRVTLDITILVPVAGGRSMLGRVEELAFLLTSVPGVTGEVRRVGLQTWAGGEYFAAPIPITVDVTTGDAA